MPDTPIPVTGGAAPIARLLLMDDEEIVLRATTRLLARLGYAVETARDGAEAVALFAAARDRGEPFDVAILDLSVPAGMGGEVCLRKLLRLDPNVRALLSSGYPNDPVCLKALEIGFRAVLGKPYELSELIRALEAILGPR